MAPGGIVRSDMLFARMELDKGDFKGRPDGAGRRNLRFASRPTIYFLGVPRMIALSCPRESFGNSSAISSAIFLVLPAFRDSAALALTF